MIIHTNEHGDSAFGVMGSKASLGVLEKELLTLSWIELQFPDYPAWGVVIVQ
jgi:hypothetical protein